MTFQGPIPKVKPHKRIKPKAGAAPTAAERAHMDWVASLPCLVSGNRPVTLHHVTGSGQHMGRLPRSHRLIVPLAVEYHQIQHGPKISVEALGHQGFYYEWGIDLLEEAKKLEAESVKAGRLPA